LAGLKSEFHLYPAGDRERASQGQAGPTARAGRAIIS